MPKGVPKSGKRNCTPRVARVSFDCEVCGKTVVLLASRLRQRAGRFCSKPCAAIGYERPLRKLTVACSHCATELQRWPSEIGQKATYCDVTCRRAAEVSTFSYSDWRSRNLDRQLEKEREWRLSNPKTVARSKRKWREANRHALRIAATHRRLLKQSEDAASREQIGAILTAAGEHCLYCGAHSAALELDHFFPVSLGGTGEAKNLIPCCRSCNATKGAKEPHVWLQERRAKGWATDVYKIKKAILAAQGVEVAEV